MEATWFSRENKSLADAFEKICIENVRRATNTLTASNDLCRLQTCATEQKEESWKLQEQERKEKWVWTPFFFSVCGLLLKRQQTVSAGMCMQRGFTVLGMCVCLSVYLSSAILAVQAMRRPMSDTNSFQTTQSWNITIAIFLKRLCLRDVPWKAKKPISVIALAYLNLIHSLCVLDTQEVTTKDVYRLLHAIYFCS